jgi:hypothetical protein
VQWLHAAACSKQQGNCNDVAAIVMKVLQKQAPLLQTRLLASMARAVAGLLSQPRQRGPGKLMLEMIAGFALELLPVLR